MKKILNFCDKHFYWVLLATLVVAIVCMPNTGLGGDFEAFEIWAKYMQDHGLVNIYQREYANYWPSFMYMLDAFRLLFVDFASFKANIFYFKIPLFLFDFGSIALLGWLLGKLKKPRYLAFLILLNPAFFYDSWIWGQTEAIYIFFAFAAIVAAIYKRPNLSFILYTLAFYSKLQAVIFLPGLILLLLPQFSKKPALIISGLFVIVMTHLVTLFPFILAGQIGAMYKNVLGSVDYLPAVSLNAYNFWVLVFGGTIIRAPDNQPLLFLTFKAWGIILFCSSSAIVLWGQFWSWIKKPREIPEVNLDYVFKVFLITGLISILFYYFPTQMHERYLQPAILFLGIVFILKPSKLSGFIYFVISIAYFLNLERYMRFLDLPERAYKLMSSQGLAAVFTLVLLLALYLLFQEKILKLLKRTNQLNS